MTSRSAIRALVGTLPLLASAAQGLSAQTSLVQDTAILQSAAPEPPAAVVPKTLPESYGEAIGTWDLSLDGSNRRCEVVLSAENSRNGRIARFPAGCRRALPVLANVAGWLYTDGGIRLVDSNIRPMLQFAPRPDRSSLIAKAESGAFYSLVPLQTIGMLPAAPPATSASDPRGDAATPDVANTRSIPGSQPVLPAESLVTNAAASVSLTTSPSPGVYALDRFNQRDVCRIELEPRPSAAKAEKDGLAARILPGCRDSGITVFDPVSWRFANGHMTLKAKKGHAVNLVAAGDGSWRRDPDVGITFILRKVEQ